MKRYLITAALAAVPCFAFAQGTGNVGPEAGDREFSISGTGSSDQDFDNTSAGVSGELGWYLSRELEVGIRQSLNFTDIEGEDISNDAWNGATRGFADYHFGSGALRPFAGASLGGIYGDGVNDSAFAGLETGLKYYVLPRTFIVGRAEYQFFFEDAGDADEGFDDGAWAYGVGVGFNF